MFELCFWLRVVSICHDVCVQVVCAPKSASSSLLARANRYPSRIQSRSTVTGTAVATRPQLHSTPKQNMNRPVALKTDAVLHRNPLTLTKIPLSDGFSQGRQDNILSDTCEHSSRAGADALQLGEYDEINVMMKFIIILNYAHGSPV